VSIQEISFTSILINTKRRTLFELIKGKAPPSNFSKGKVFRRSFATKGGCNQVNNLSRKD
jgi:hypothetical protein